MEATGNIQAATSLGVTAADHAVIVCVAGNGGGATGVALAGAVSLNNLQPTVRASITGGTEVSPSIIVSAKTDSSKISSIAVSGGGAVGVAGGGSDSTNQIVSHVEALAGGHESSPNPISVTAADTSTIISVAGNGQGAEGVAVGGAISMNSIEANVKAALTGGSVDAPSVAMDADGHSNVTSIAAGGGGAVGVSADGSDSTNTLGGTIEAAGGGRHCRQCQRFGQPCARMRASPSSRSPEPSAGPSAWPSPERYRGTISAPSRGPMSPAPTINAPRTNLTSDSTAEVTSIAVSASGSAVAAGGSDSANTIDGTVESVVAAGSSIQGSDKLDLEANDNSTIRAVSGNAEGGGVSIGLSVSANTIGPNVHAGVSGSQRQRSHGDHQRRDQFGYRLGRRRRQSGRRSRDRRSQLDQHDERHRQCRHPGGFGRRGGELAGPHRGRPREHRLRRGPGRVCARGDIRRGTLAEQHRRDGARLWMDRPRIRRRSRFRR